VLQAFLSGVTDPNGALSTWTGSDPCSGWSGVTCDASSLVSSIDLEYDSLSSTLPAGFGYLNHLTYLNLRTNSFSGSLPAAWSKLTALAQVRPWGQVGGGGYSKQLQQMRQVLGQ
jgi:hypothetical protein